jgi:uncharacterized membrane protein
MKFKVLALFAVILAAFVGLTSLVSADRSCVSTPFWIEKVEVNGMQVDEFGSPVYAERGKTLPVVVYLQGTKDSYDTRVEAWIGGYEYDEIEAKTDIFNVINGVKDRKVLLLDLPDDMEASDNYTLNIEVSNDDESCHNKYILRIEPARHKIDVFDTILSPSSTVKAGQPLFVSVRVENMGDNAEDSVKVTAKISALGLEASDYLDELSTEEESDSCDEDCENSASANDLVLMIPSTAAAGDYNLDVIVTYNKGHSAVKQTYTVKVLPATQVVSTQSNALVNVDSNSLTTSAGEGAVYKISLANLGETAQTYTFDVVGVSGWGAYSVDPQSLTLGKDQTGVANLYVSPSEDTAAGLKTLTVKVKAGTETVKELTLNLNVAENQNSYDMAKKVLLIVFVVLLIILIILGIVVAAKKLGGKEQNTEGQAYY